MADFGFVTQRTNDRGFSFFWSRGEHMYEEQPLPLNQTRQIVGCFVQVIKIRGVSGDPLFCIVTTSNNRVTQTWPLGADGTYLVTSYSIRRCDGLSERARLPEAS